MKLEDIGEFGLIGRIRTLFTQPSPKAPIGIGDDAAALFLSSAAVLLATTDMLIEGVHFDLATTDLYSLGWKSAAVNLSDIAAMGGVPRYCLVGLGLPRRTTMEQVRELYRGLHALLRKHAVLLVGGDTCRSGRGLVISVVMLGEARKRSITARSGARSGDLVFTTGTLGDAAAGFELLAAGGRARKRGARKLVERHLRPEPRVEWGGKLAASGCVSAMIDVSDGLASDLGHICEESRVGAEVHEGLLPLSRALVSTQGLKQAPLAYALSGGEDYELLFTVPPRKAAALRRLNIPFTEIGTIIRRRSLLLVDHAGRRRRLTAAGYDHFGKRDRLQGRRR